MTELIKTLKTSLNGEELTLHKLKAGKYYEAQKIYIGMIDAVRNKQVDYATETKDKKIKEKDIKEKAESLDIKELYNVFPQEMAKLVAFCLDMEVEKLLENAYPEELSEIAGKVIKLNNFNENLKNSVAPLGNLGAKAE